MKTPVRWLEEGGDAPLGARELLGAAAPTPAFTDAIRYRLAVGVAKTATLPAATAWGTLVAKSALVIALGGASGFAVHTWAGAHGPTVQLPTPAVPAAPAAVPQTGTQDPPTVSVDQLPTLQLPNPATEPSPRLKLDPRLQEAELLEKARALVGANPAAALKLTAEHARDFPKGRLGAEADLIAAQSLLGMGKAVAAKQRAQASLARYPNGIYARQLHEIVDSL